MHLTGTAATGLAQWAYREIASLFVSPHWSQALALRVGQPWCSLVRQRLAIDEGTLAMVL